MPKLLSVSFYFQNCFTANVFHKKTGSHILIATGFFYSIKFFL